MNWNKALGAFLVLTSVAGGGILFLTHTELTKSILILLLTFLGLGVALFNQPLADDLLNRAGTILPFLKPKSGGQ